MKDIIDSLKVKLNNILELVKDDLNGVKTGRAKPSLIENIKVQIYGTQLTLKEVASISSPEPHLLIVAPWDKNRDNFIAIQRAIASSGLGFNPQADKEILRISVPPLTEETRRDLVKLVALKLESGRRMIRQERNDARTKVQGQKGEPGVSDDDIHSGLEELQKVTDEYSSKLEAMGKAKEQELMEL